MPRCRTVWPWTKSRTSPSCPPSAPCLICPWHRRWCCRVKRSTSHWPWWWRCTILNPPSRCAFWLGFIGFCCCSCWTWQLKSLCIFFMRSVMWHVRHFYHLRTFHFPTGFHLVFNYSWKLSLFTFTQPNTPVGGEKDQWVTIRLLQTDKKEHILRGAKVDRVIKWINLLSLVSGLCWYGVLAKRNICFKMCICDVCGVNITPFPICTSLRAYPLVQRLLPM